MNTWHTLQSIRAAWGSAPKSDELLGDLLETSRDQCIDHLQAEGLPVAAGTQDDPVPARCRMAQQMNARALWEGQKANLADDTIGLEGYQVAVFPMGRQIKDLLGYGSLGIS